MGLFDLIEQLADIAKKVEPVKDAGEALLGRGIITAEKLSDDIAFGKKLFQKGQRKERVGTLEFAVKVGSHILRR